MGPNDRCFSHGLVNTALGTVQPPNVIDAPKAIQSPVAAYVSRHQQRLATCRVLAAFNVPRGMKIFSSKLFCRRHRDPSWLSSCRYVSGCHVTSITWGPLGMHRIRTASFKDTLVIGVQQEKPLTCATGL